MDPRRSDASLLEAWRAGDSLAGNELVRRHFATVYRFLWNKVGEDAIDDLVQITFLACVAGRDRLRENSAFRAYVLGIARLELLKHMRKCSRRDRAMTARAQQPATSILSPSGKLVRHEEQKLLVLALRELPLDLQIALELYYWDGLPIGEVAAVLEIPPGTVKSRLARARTALRERILTFAATEAVRKSTLDALEAWAGSFRELLDRAPPDET